MKNVQDYYLEPGEYVSKSVVGSLPGFHFAVLHGLMITKDGANTWIRTPCNVDEGCRILHRWSGKGAGRVKHLTSTPRRRYYLCLMWFTIIMWVLAWIFVLTEMLVFNNPAVGDSRARLVMGTAYIGDSEVDYDTAHNSGLKCISVLWGFRDKEYLEEIGADIFAEKPGDIPGILEPFEHSTK